MDLNSEDSKNNKSKIQNNKKKYLLNQKSKEENSNDIDKINRDIVTFNKNDDNNEHLSKDFPLILINANNPKNHYHPLKSNYIIDIVKSGVIAFGFF